MSEVKEFVSRIHKERQEKIKEIEERKRQEEENKKKCIEHYSTLILNVFDESNKEGYEELVVKVKVVHNYNEKRLECSVAFSTDYKAEYMNVADITRVEKTNELKKVLAAMQVVNACESLPTTIGDIAKYLKENVSEFFKVYQDDKKLIITICENEEKKE